MEPRRRWQEFEFYLVMHLYQRIPFGQQDKSNRKVIDLASALGRSSSAVAMRLGNFTALDPTEKARGISGLPGGGQQCEQFWQKYYANLEIESAKAELMWNHIVIAKKDPAAIGDPDDPERVFTGNTEVLRNSVQRLGQSFFRRAVLDIYHNKCCITGLPICSLLVASHILPWAQFPASRVDPSNGLCLSKIHDAAFDKGLITFDEQYRLVISKEIVHSAGLEVVKDMFLKYEGLPLTLPEKNLPSQHALSWHRNELFIG